MAKTATAAENEPSKAQLQREMARTRESLAETVGELKDTVEKEVGIVKKGVTDVMDYREQFQKDPIVWSLGALSAGFALGYTVGYAHKNSKGAKGHQIPAFADTMIDQLSEMGEGLLLPVLDAKIKELFGVDFSAMLQQAGKTAGPSTKAKKRSPARPKLAAKKPVKSSKRHQ